MENRSFDNYFHDYPGADGAASGTLSDGTAIPLAPTGFGPGGLGHGWKAAMRDWDHGKNDGFANAPPSPLKGYPLPARYLAYSYVERPLIAPYWAMAKRFVLADHMFPTEWGASWTSHLDLISGTTALSPTESLVDLPNNTGDCDAPAGTTTSIITKRRVYLANLGPFPCFSNYRTLADSLDAAHVSWRYYFEPAFNDDLWNAFQAIKSIRYGPDWSNVVYSSKQVIVDARNGRLPGVAWAIPDYTNSDHSNSVSDTGPSWVASIVNTIGQGPEWKSTAIVVVWDEWGGWYDHVAPPALDYLGLGYRVPCLIISPYAKRGYVSHTQYEFGSILKTVEQLFGLASLGTTDFRANSMLDAFDFTQSPRPFAHIDAKYPTTYFMNQRPSHQSLDDE